MYEYLRRYIRRGVKPLRENDSIREAARRLSTEQLTDLPVVGSEEKLAGLFGEKELIEALSPRYLQSLRDTHFIARDFEDIADEAMKVMDKPVAEFMRTEYATLPSDFSVLHCAELFLHKRQGVIPIVEDDRPVALLRRSDFARAIIEAAARRRGMDSEVSAEELPPEAAPT
ncbi:MAG: CBS domain-containing protein [Solirubrobacterales bacterium]